MSRAIGWGRPLFPPTNSGTLCLECLDIETLVTTFSASSLIHPFGRGWEDAGMSPVNEFGQPIGEAVEWSPRPAPQAVRLVGRYVVVEPVAPEHAESLYAATSEPARIASPHP